VPKGTTLSSIVRSTVSRTSSLNFLNPRWSTRTLNSLRTGSTWRMLILRIIRPSSHICSNSSMSSLYVKDVSPSRPAMMLMPGSSLGMPLGPLSAPISLIMRTAAMTCSDVLLRLFSLTTIGSADSMPRATMFPSVQQSAMICRTSLDSSG